MSPQTEQWIADRAEAIAKSARFARDLSKPPQWVLDELAYIAAVEADTRAHE